MELAARSQPPMITSPGLPHDATVVLEAGDSRLCIDPEAGGRWTSLTVQGLELLTGTSIPGASPAILSGCFPMAPYAGRIGGGVLDWKGRRTDLPLTAPPHAIHGTVLDRPWSVRSAGAARAVLEVPLQPPWPYAGSVRQEVWLHPGGLGSRLVLLAEEQMPAVLGWHPWFPRRLDRGGPAELVVRGGRQYVRGCDGLPTGELVSPQEPPWDDCFRDLDSPPLVRWPGALELTITSSGNHWVLFTERPDALCVEPQTGPPDAFRLGEAATVDAGDALTLEMAWQWRSP